MEQKFIMTAFGEDRPGFVADVTELIYEHECNLEDSTMTRLSNEFTMIFLFSGHGDNLEDQLARACRRLEREKGISAFFRAVETSLTTSQTRMSTHTMHVEGIDQAGIVYHVSKYLATYRINIIDLSSLLRFSAESGTAMYTITLHIEIPAEASMENLEKGLLELGDELDVDITLPQ